MEILNAYDLTGSFRDAGELAGCSHHTVKHYVERRAVGGEMDQAAQRPMLIDEYLPKVEEWVERSKGKVRADVAHEKLVALGYTGSERTTRRAVAKVKQSYRSGHVRVHRPWITEPGMWLQYDYGDGPVVDGVKTVLFVAWLAWSRFRIVLPLRDKTMPSVFAALDVTFRRLGGVPTYVLTDNEKTVTVEHIAGIPVRNPQLVAFAEHYSVTVHTCVPADPASKGGTEASVKISKADLVPKDTNLLEAYGSFAELEAACEEFCEKVNTRPHRVTRRPPVEMLAEERARLHPVAMTPHTVAFGTTRQVPANTPMVTFESGQYSVPHQLLGATVWVRTHGVGNPAAARLVASAERSRPATSSANSAFNTSAGSQRWAFAVATTSGAWRRMCGNRSRRNSSSRSAGSGGAVLIGLVIFMRSPRRCPQRTAERLVGRAVPRRWCPGSARSPRSPGARPPSVLGRGGRGSRTGRPRRTGHAPRHARVPSRPRRGRTASPARALRPS